MIDIVEEGRRKCRNIVACHHLNATGVHRRVHGLVGIICVGCGLRCLLLAWFLGDLLFEILNLRQVIIELLLKFVLVILKLQDLVRLLAQLHLQIVYFLRVARTGSLVRQISDGTECSGAALQSLTLEGIHELPCLHF